jgi:DNA-binding GntR family transcriptional regulator
MREAAAEHGEIADLLARGKGDGAAKALERHLRSSLASSLRLLRAGAANGQP